MKKSTKIIRLSVTLLLLIAMLLTPMSPVFAVVIENGDADLTAADIVSEDASKREKFSRHYLTGDGTYFAVSYAEQVNYQDEDGNWIAVDNSLSTNVLTGEKTTKNDKFKVKFANKANKDNLVSIQTNDYKVSFGITVSEDGESYLELNKVKGTESESNTSAEPKTTQEATSLGKAVSGITYVDAFSDYLDVRYSVAHEKVKEDLILERKSGFNSYKVTYNIKEKDALATLNDDGSITFTSPDGALLFNVGVPVMYDSDGKSSADIAVSMTQDKKTVEVTYTPSAEWLNAEERVYPVTIDPTIESRTSNDCFYESVLCYSSDPYETLPHNTGNIVTIYQEQSYYLWLTAPTLYLDEGFNSAKIILTMPSYTIFDSIIAEYISSVWFPGEMVYDDGSLAIPTTNDSFTINIAQNTDTNQIAITIPNDYILNSGGYQSYFGDNYYGHRFTGDSNTYLNIYACSYSITSYRPCMVVTYTDSVYISNAGVQLGDKMLSSSYTANFLSTLNRNSSQIWKITHIGDDYYSIVNNDTGAVLTSSTTGFISSYFSGTDNQLWRLTKTSNGSYKLKSKAQESGNNVLGMNSAGNLANVNYTINSEYSDEWQLYILDFKYVNYYDSSFAGTNLINYIPDAVEFANTVYGNLCKISFEMEGNATQYMAFIADDCDRGENTPCNNSCGSSCSSHHKNIENISNQFYNLGIRTNERYVIWTNRPENTYCENERYGTHTTVNSIAVVYDSRPVIHVMRVAGTTAEQQKAVMALTLAHETAHTFGMPDVYDTPGHYDNDDEYMCIMDYCDDEEDAVTFYNAVLGGAQPFCDSCTTEIRNNILEIITK